MLTAIITVVIAIIVRFVVVFLAKSYPFWEGLVTPINIVMWATIVIGAIYILIKLIKELK